LKRNFNWRSTKERWPFIKKKWEDWIPSGKNDDVDDDCDLHFVWWLRWTLRPLVYLNSSITLFQVFVFGMLQWFWPNILRSVANEIHRFSFESVSWNSVQVVVWSELQLHCWVCNCVVISLLERNGAI
jgi:hypothetical protein